MPITFELLPNLKGSGWKVKIREKETVEPPHVTVINGLNAWRWDLRKKKFMDKKPPKKLVPKAIVKFLKENHDAIVAAWDKKYPLNKVTSGDEK
jgi:hypothetical protein